MNAARAYRRLKEVEEKKISNRLALLRAELANSEAKVIETKNRKAQVDRNAAKIQKHHEKKVQTLTARTITERGMAQTSARNRIASDMHREHVMMETFNSKRAMARQVFEERQKNRELIQEQKRRELARGIQMRKRIQRQRQEMQNKRLQAEEQKKMEARRLFTERIRAEAERSLACEKNVAAMEQEELALIRRLEEAQIKQRTAYAELEDAVNQTRDMMAVHRHEQREKQSTLARSRLKGSMTSRARGRRLRVKSAYSARGPQSSRRSSRSSRSSLKLPPPRADSRRSSMSRSSNRGREMD